jgi:hypothetical protein
MGGTQMGFLSDMRRVNGATDFARVLGQRGGCFETNCSPEQVLAFLKASSVEVTKETPTSLSARPVSKNGAVAPDVITAQVSAGNKLPTLVVISVQLNPRPGETNPMIINNPLTIPPLLGLLLKISKTDPKWQRA